MALAGIDMAAWDAAAKHARACRWCGCWARRRSPVPAYNSNGLGIIGHGGGLRRGESAGRRASRAIKVRLGYPTVADDLAVVRKRCAMRRWPRRRADERTTTSR